MNFDHLAHLSPCPHLPVPDAPVGSEATRRFRNGERGAAFYEAALLFGQSLWLRGYPAKALLLVNRALGADLRGSESILERWPLPYAAAAWLMANRQEEQFIGNPRRHYQHLATRMVEPRRELRTWRAWACWHIASSLFPDMPVDAKQIQEEGVLLPEKAQVLAMIARLGIPEESALVEAAWISVQSGRLRC